MQKISYARYRFPPVIIQHSVWLYFRFPLSYRDVEDLLAERGVYVSYETVRRWALKFGQAYARRLRTTRPRPDGRWHLDEVFVSINGKRMYLWRAVDSEGEVLDILVQSRRNKTAALKLMRKLMKKQGIWASPSTMILVAGRTTGRRILICQSGNANDECRDSSHLDQRSDFSLPTPPSTTPSTSNAI
jgi:transposase-like protein